MNAQDARTSEGLPWDALAELREQAEIQISLNAERIARGAVDMRCKVKPEAVLALVECAEVLQEMHVIRNTLTFNPFDTVTSGRCSNAWARAYKALDKVKTL